MHLLPLADSGVEDIKIQVAVDLERTHTQRSGQGEDGW
jgi:hypothetical protein